MDVGGRGRTPLSRDLLTDVRRVLALYLYDTRKAA